MIRAIAVLVLVAAVLVAVNCETAGKSRVAIEAGQQIPVNREFVISIPTSGQFLPENLDAQLQRIISTASSLSEVYGVEVVGYTDDFGGELENLLLSLRRAGAVGERLAELGIEDGLISFDGFGELQPVADNATEQGRNANRRVVVRVAGRERVSSTNLNAMRI